MEIFAIVLNEKDNVAVVPRAVAKGSVVTAAGVHTAVIYIIKVYVAIYYNSIYGTDCSGCTAEVPFARRRFGSIL